jgi:ABC-2 type transport system permease protein
MKKIMRLLSVQLWAALGDMFTIGKNRKKKPTAIYVGVSLLVIFLSFVSFFYSFVIGSGLKSYGCTEILPALMMAVTCIITLMTTVFKVKGTIFGFRDYDLVMSLPIDTGAIAASRLILLYVLNFMFVLIVMVPALLAYGILMKPDILFYIIGFVTMFFIPLVPIVIASFIGALIAFASTRFKHNNLVSILLSMGFLVLIMALSFRTEDNTKQLVNLSKSLAARINQIYPLSGMYIKALVHYDISSLLLFLGISLSAFAFYTAIVKKIFKKMNTLMMTGSYHTNYKMGRLKTTSPFRALYQKELKRFFSSTQYVVNSGFGIVMLTAAAVASIFVDLNKVFADEVAVEAIVTNSPVYICFCIIMTCTTMASISLEGKNLWIMKSLPVSPKTVYLSKIAVNLTVIAPAVIDVIILGIAFKMPVVQILICLMITLVCAAFTSFYGLFMNLLLPNFTWTSEIVVIKNSAATLITVFSSMVYVGVLFLFLAVIPSAITAYLCYFL